MNMSHDPQNQPAHANNDLQPADDDIRLIEEQIDGDCREIARMLGLPEDPLSLPDAPPVDRNLIRRVYTAQATPEEIATSLTNSSYYEQWREAGREIAREIREKITDE